MSCGCVNNPIIPPSQNCNVEYVACAGLPLEINLSPLCSTENYTVTIEENPEKGTVEIQANDIIYLPSSDSSGDDMLVYNITCENGFTKTCTATFHITESIGDGKRKIYISAAGSKCIKNGVEFTDPTYYWYGFNEYAQLDTELSKITDEGIYVIVDQWDPIANPDPVSSTIFVKICCGECDTCCKTVEFKWQPPTYEGNNCSVPDCSEYPCSQFNETTGNCEHLCDECENCCEGVCKECCDETDCPNGQNCLNGQCTCPNGTLPDENGNCLNCENNNDCNCGQCINGECIPCEDCPEGTVPDCITGFSLEDPCPCVECILDEHCEGLLECIEKECVCPPDKCTDPITGECVVCPECINAIDCDECEQCINGVCVEQSCPGEVDELGNPIFIRNPNGNNPCCIQNPCLNEIDDFEINQIQNDLTIQLISINSSGGNPSLAIFKVYLKDQVVEPDEMLINFTNLVNDYEDTSLDGFSQTGSGSNTSYTVQLNKIGNGFVLKAEYKGRIYISEWFIPSSVPGDAQENVILESNCRRIYEIISKSDSLYNSINISGCENRIIYSDEENIVLSCEGTNELCTLTINGEKENGCFTSSKIEIEDCICDGVCQGVTNVIIDSFITQDENGDDIYNLHASVKTDAGNIFYLCQPPEFSEWVDAGSGITNNYSGFADKCGTLPNDGFIVADLNNPDTFDCDYTTHTGTVSPNKPCGWVVNDVEILFLNGSNLKIKATNEKPIICFGVQTECGYVSKCIDIVRPLKCADAKAIYTAPTPKCGNDTVIVEAPKVSLGKRVNWEATFTNATHNGNITYSGNAQTIQINITDPTKKVIIDYTAIEVAFEGETCNIRDSKTFEIDPCTVVSCAINLTLNYKFENSNKFLIVDLIGTPGDYQLIINGPSGIEIQTIITVGPSGTFNNTYQIMHSGTYTVDVFNISDQNCSDSEVVDVPNFKSKTYNIDCSIGCVEDPNENGEFISLAECQSQIEERCENCEINTNNPEIEDDNGNGNPEPSNYKYSLSNQAGSFFTMEVPAYNIEKEKEELSEELKNELLSKENVNGVSIGLKKSNGSYIGEVAIVVTVNKKVSLKELSEEDKVPTVINGIKTDVKVKPIAQSFAYCNHGGCALDECPSHVQDFPLIQAGQSISYGSSRGTLGTIAKHNDTGELVGITNNHVLGGLNTDLVCSPKVQANDPVYNTIISGSSFTKGSKIGNVLKNIPFTKSTINETDAASFKIDLDKVKRGYIEISNSQIPWMTENELNSTLGKFIYRAGGTTGTVNPDINQGPIGTITEVSGNKFVAVCEVIQFSDVITVEVPDNLYIPIGLQGDSGSPVIVKINGEFKLLGLLFAGYCGLENQNDPNSDQINFIYVTPIWKVAELLNVSRWDGSVNISQDAGDSISINGECYNKVGTTLESITHTLYNNC